MACVSGSLISIVPNPTFKTHQFNRRIGRFDHCKLRIRASSDESEDCNAEECAPDKEVGRVSVEWLAGEKTKVGGTFPPRKKGWTGYVEKDTAGQTNIYSVEPSVYVAESAISSGTPGSSSDGAENTAAIAAGIALISVAAASSILLQVGKNNPNQIQTAPYSGPALTYYINKFAPPQILQPSSVPTQIDMEAPPPESQNSTPEEVPQVPAETSELPSSTPTSNVVDNNVVS